MPGNSPYLSAETAIETLTCLFFSDDTAVSDALRRPLAPAAALILCLVANGDESGLSRPEALFGLRFAFDALEAGQIADAGFAAAIDAGLATLHSPQSDHEVERLRLTSEGQHVIDNLQHVLRPEWE
jgi:hypothetical protein